MARGHGPYCSGFCPVLTTRVLEVEGVTVVAATSTCENAEFASTSVNGKPLPLPATCHFDITLSSGETHGFDVPFTDYRRNCCCGSCEEGDVSDWTTVAIVVLPSFDAAALPPFDASDAADATDAAPD